MVTILVSVLLMKSCETKNKIFWVGGTKTECSSGVGKMQCLTIHRGENLDDATWENFYSNIEGFEFEEGMFKKIEVKEEKIENPPADGSSIRYILVKELDKKVDNRANIKGKWRLNTLNNNPINRSNVLPEIEILPNKMLISGNGGCNNYTGKINKLSNNIINLGYIASTKKACLNKNIEQDYFNVLSKVKTFKVTDDNLVFFDENGNKIASYLKITPKVANQKIHDIWIATKIMGNPINRMSETPRLEVNLTEMTVYGNDGCNNFNGVIKEVSDTEIILGNIAITKKMCRKMEVPDLFNKALSKVKSYKLEGLTLILLDAKGEEVLQFLKGD